LPAWAARSRCQERNSPTHDNGSPAYGNEFSTEGCIYKPGTLNNSSFDFGPEVGVRSVVTDGYETPEINKPIRRAITGGTGKYVAAKGEQTQWMLRFPNPTFGLNARIELRIHDDDRR
jgi:hypothetical protein